ncbi:MAG: glycosyltransferase family 117 protein, partial [Thermoanaerobaculia bacterium]
MADAGEREAGRSDKVFAAGIFGVLFAVYALGACRTIYVGDSGELLTAVHVLGIPHPSGYPLYVLLGKLWTLVLPLGSVAWEMSLFSGVCAAGACALLFSTARENGCGRTSSLLAASLLGFAPSFWLEANTQRVYALNALFVVIAVRFALRWYRGRAPRDLVLAMVSCGLGATNHTFMGLVGIAVALFAPAVDSSLFRKPKLVAACGVGFFAGLLVYLYLPIRSRFDPVLDWGNPETPAALLDVLLRRSFWLRRWYESPWDFATVAWDFAAAAARETGWIALPLAAIAILAAKRYRGVVGLPLLVVAANVGALAIHGSYYDIFIWHRYYIPGYAMVALLAAFGLEALATRIDRRLLAFALLPALLMFGTGFPRHDLSRYRVAEDYTSKLLASLPPGAKLFATDDNILFV